MLLPDRVGTMSPAGVADVHSWPEPEAPWVRALMVSTADGAARSPKGVSGGISSAGDRLLFATIRGLSDVILVGAETVRSEGYGPVRPRPELADRRASLGQEPLPRIAIVTGSGDLDTATPLFTESSPPPLVLCPASIDPDRRSALEQVAEVVEVGTDRVEMADAVAALGGLGLNRIVCEGGPRLLGQIAAAGQLRELCLTITPLLSGGSYESHAVPRILDGAVLPDAPKAIRLAHIIEDHGTLFLRYVIEP